MFAQRLRFLRSRRKITQAQLAQHVGISQQSVAKWENERSEPSNDALKIIAKFFNVTIDYLLDNEKDEDVLTNDEVSLVETYRHLDTDGKTLIVSVLDKIKQAQDNRPLIDQSNNNGNLINVNGSNNVLTANG